MQWRVTNAARISFRVEARNAAEGAGARLAVEAGDLGVDELVAPRLAGGRRLRLVDPDTDEQVLRDADNFPAHEQQQEAVGQHEAKHPGGKQR